MAIKYEVGLKTKIALEDYEIEQKLDSKMERYVMRLVKNPDNTFKLTSLDDSDLSFNEVYNITKKLNEYVVVVYGSSKLRPQYVSTNEMMFIGVDRSTETKILRILYTPTRLTYETFKVVEQPQLDDISSQIANYEERIETLENSDSNSENKSYKVSKINDSNKNNEIMYPNVKAVTDYVNPLNQAFGELQSFVNGLGLQVQDGKLCAVIVE